MGITDFQRCSRANENDHQDRRPSLFQGDGNTTHRDQLCTLGTGYTHHVVCFLPCIRRKYAVNRGIGGKQIHDLEARWDEDCRSKRVLSIVRVSDCWSATAVTFTHYHGALG